MNNQGSHDEYDVIQEALSTEIDQVVYLGSPCLVDCRPLDARGQTINVRGGLVLSQEDHAPPPRCQRPKQQDAKEKGGSTRCGFTSSYHGIHVLGTISL